jgi:hypothetical protein
MFQDFSAFDRTDKVMRVSTYKLAGVGKGLELSEFTGSRQASLAVFPMQPKRREDFPENACTFEKGTMRARFVFGGIRKIALDFSSAAANSRFKVY